MENFAVCIITHYTPKIVFSPCLNRMFYVKFTFLTNSIVWSCFYVYQSSSRIHFYTAFASPTKCETEWKQKCNVGKKREKITLQKHPATPGNSEYEDIVKQAWFVSIMMAL